MAGFVKYPQYQATKYPWIGNLPINWNVRRLKEVGRLFGGAGFPHEYQNVQGEELYFYKVGDLSLSENEKTLLASPHTISKETARVLRAAIVPEGAIVYAKIGAALLLNRRRMTTAACCIDNNMTAYVTEAEILTPEWAFYWLSTIDFSEHVNPGAVPSFSEGYQSVLPIPVPPVEEQKLIARFLDFKTTQIDSLIAKKKALLDKLAEKRTALISHAVTKGLDPSVPIKDSGVPWLGKIPAHWDEKRLKYAISEPLKYGANEAAELTDTDLPRYIRITDVNDDGSLREETFRSLPDEVANSYLLSDGDILLARSGATVGKSFIYKPSWGVAAYAGYLIRARMADMMDADFAYLFLQSSCYWQWLNSVFIQATIQNVSAEKYANLVISVPPIDEQLAIVSYLHEQLKKIDAQRDRVSSVVDRLIEYRSAIITNAVTGKIDVRGFEVPQTAEGLAS